MHTILKGQIYTVESVFEDYAPHVGRFTALRLVGIPASTFHKRGIWVRRFRLLSEVQRIVSAVSKNKTTYEPITSHVPQGALAGGHTASWIAG